MFWEAPPAPPSRSRLTMVVASVVLLAVLAGCGEASGVEEGATVTAYVAAPLCAEAKQELERRGAKAGELRVRVFCLEVTAPQEGPAGRRGIDLATVGANARRATEDSTAVGYLEAAGAPRPFLPPDPRSRRDRHRRRRLRGERRWAACSTRSTAADTGLAAGSRSATALE